MGLNRKLLLWLAAALLLAGGRASGAEPSEDPGEAARTEFFERQVRPILAEHCFVCHGGKKQQAGLRLDSRQALLKGGENGPVVDLEKPANSRLLVAIGYADTDLQMPPDGRLPAEAIAALARWIADGAAWPTAPPGSGAEAELWKTHWAFQPPGRPKIPDVRASGWPQSPIDHFVLARLEAEQMAPAGPADRATLLRRASQDLVGLPPTDPERADFINDPAPDAFAKVVDRLLDSPHFGERWGRYWLDVARYADTKGYVRLQEERRFLFAFAYRDYVIRSFNEDLPFDRFIIEQLAADRLPPTGDNRHLAALGFLTLGRQFTSNRHDIIDDRIDVTTRGLMGLTVTCARCHDHKYDPIPTADYYSLYGVFASSEDAIVPPRLSQATAEPEAADPEFETRFRALDEYEAPQYAALLNEFRARTSDYLDAALAGRAPPQQPLPTAPGELRAWVVDRWIDYLERTEPGDLIFAAWHALAALPAPEFESAAAAFFSNDLAGQGAAIRSKLNSLVRQRFVERPPKSRHDLAIGYGQLLAEVHARWQGLLASTTAAASGGLDRLPDPDEEALRQVLYSAASAVAVSKQEALAQYLYDSTINNEIYKRRNAIQQHLADTAARTPRAHVLEECPLAYDPRIFLRGNPTRPAGRVPRQFLSALGPGTHPPFQQGSGRLELARAIASADNPLTARVLVNRVWAHHFGAGLVRTPSNFGLRGQPPSHPELLDYLARRFMDEGWSLKKLHRTLMLSSTYQESSHNATNYESRDPENRLLWKTTRRRLDFEALRDSLLVVADRLDRTSGGPSVDLSAPAANRRSVYGLIDRQSLPAMLATFDFASPDAHSGERYATTVPQQALFLMNSPLVAEVARAFAARRDVTALASPADRVTRMVQIAWGRAPTANELQRALDYLNSDQATAPGAGALNSWEALAQTLLLSNEFMYVD